MRTMTTLHEDANVEEAEEVEATEAKLPEEKCQQPSRPLLDKGHHQPLEGAVVSQQ